MKKSFLLLLCVCGGLVSGADTWSSANPARYQTASFANAVWYETFQKDGEEPFTVEYCGGAKGKVEILNTGGRSEARVLKTVKTNDQGYILDFKFKWVETVKI